jgi:mRNA interferase MazF
VKRGDIVTVAPPREFGKPRPALIVQSDIAFDAPNLLYLPITSDLLRVPDVPVPIEPSAENGLRLPSEIMVDIIQTSPREKFGQVIGQIDSATMMLVEAALSLRLGLLD